MTRDPPPGRTAPSEPAVDLSVSTASDARKMKHSHVGLSRARQVTPQRGVEGAAKDVKRFNVLGSARKCSKGRAGVALQKASEEEHTKKPVPVPMGGGSVKPPTFTQKASTHRKPDTQSRRALPSIMVPAKEVAQDAEEEKAAEKIPAVTEGRLRQLVACPDDAMEQLHQASLSMHSASGMLQGRPVPAARLPRTADTKKADHSGARYMAEVAWTTSSALEEASFAVADVGVRRSSQVGEMSQSFAALQAEVDRMETMVSA